MRQTDTRYQERDTSLKETVNKNSQVGRVSKFGVSEIKIICLKKNVSEVLSHIHNR